MQKIFNPKEWLTVTAPEQKVMQPKDTEPKTVYEEAEMIIRELETKRIDLTQSYKDWVNIGFALSDGFGESGRDLFKRVSAMYAGYDAGECDRQFTQCLKSKKSGVTIKSFFFKAKDAGIDISLGKYGKASEKNGMESRGELTGEFTGGEMLEQKLLLPNFPDSLFPQLPEFLKRVVQVAASNEERDILLLGSITAISACLPKLYGIYDGRKVFSNLFLFITAQASAGKGRLIHCRQLVNPVHKELRDRARELKQRYEIELAQFNAAKGKEENAEKPAKPPEKMLFIPANNSSTGAYQLLGDSDGRGLIFETEGDTLAQAFKSDYGNYSDGFRKSFHHETVSYYRRTDREYVDIESPCLSAVLSGTPQQVSALIPSAENGLFSRFMFYSMNVRPVWKNVFESAAENGLEAYFDDLGNEFYALYGNLMRNPDIKFTLTEDQKMKFNDLFSEIQTMYISLKGLDYMGSVRRLGLIAFRIAMILSALRILEHGEIPEKMVCEERDYATAIAMVKVLVRHSAKVYSELPQETKPQKQMNKKEKFLNSLPRNFNRQKYLETASGYGIPGKTAEGYIASFKKGGLVHHEAQDNYINLTAEEIEELKEMDDGKESSEDSATP